MNVLKLMPVSTFLFCIKYSRTVTSLVEQGKCFKKFMKVTYWIATLIFFLFILAMIVLLISSRH